jgi:hypothetical protein
MSSKDQVNIAEPEVKSRKIDKLSRARKRATTASLRASAVDELEDSEEENLLVLEMQRREERKD